LLFAGKWCGSGALEEANKTNGVGFVFKCAQPEFSSLVAAEGRDRMKERAS